MKLNIEMVPKSSWNKNLRSMLKQSQWDLVRKKCYELANNRCDICGAKKKLHCHEVWGFDDENNTQFLTGLRAVCSTCHLCHHIGFAIIQHYDGKLNFDYVRKHFIQLNGITEKEFSEILKKEMEQWINRSKKEWKIDIDFLREYCEKNKINI